MRNSRFAGLIVALAGAVSAQSISSYLIGNNAWMPPWSYNGKIDALWGKMETARFQTIRIGGNGAMSDNKAIGAGAQASGYYRVLYLIDSVRAAGAEPIVQVPHEYSTAEATQYITYINGTAKRGIKLWSIGNEPDNNNVGDGYVVGTYTRRIASGLKAYDPNAFVITGDHAWYNTQHLDVLIGGGSDITGKDAAGNYYVDAISWHRYGLNDITSIEANVDDFKTRIAAANAKRPADKQISWVLGEWNMHYINSLITNPDQYPWTFHAGQVFAEAYDLGMRKGAFAICPWSMHEDGGARSTTGTDLSLFDNPEGGYTPRSSYWHSLMLGQNMKSKYLAHTANSANLTIVPMGDATGVAVMLLNKSKTTAIAFDLRLDGGAFTGKSATQLRVEAGLTQEISGTLAAYSTQMLVFDAAGALVKRYTYTSANADARTGPTIETLNIPPQSCATYATSTTIQAESFCRGGGTQSLAAIDSGDGFYVGYTDPGDSLVYKVNIPSSGRYVFRFRVASNEARSSFLLHSGSKLLDSLVVDSTGGWQAWKTRSLEATLSAGIQDIRLIFTDGGMNLNWLLIEPTAPTSIGDRLERVPGKKRPNGIEPDVDVLGRQSRGVSVPTR
jgi:hypothetical protein